MIPLTLNKTNQLNIKTMPRGVKSSPFKKGKGSPDKGRTGRSINPMALEFQQEIDNLKVGEWVQCNLAILTRGQITGAVERVKESDKALNIETYYTTEVVKRGEKILGYKVYRIR